MSNESGLPDSTGSGNSNVREPEKGSLVQINIPAIKLADGQIALDYTSTHELQECWLRGKRFLVDGLRAKRPSTPLIFGGAYHEAKAIWFQTHDINKTIDHFKAIYETPKDETLRTQERGVKSLKLYAEKFPTEPFEIVEIETPIVYDIGHSLIKRLVVPDLVIRWDGRYYGWETKTTGSFGGASYFDQFSPNEQIDSQTAGIKAKWGSCDGVYIEVSVFRKGGPRSKLPELEFYRKPIGRTPEDIAWYKRDICDVYDQYIERLKSNKWPANRASCHDFKEGCPYRLLCRAGDDDITRDEYERTENFYIKRWNPFDK